jgi:hypothetical protein
MRTNDCIALAGALTIFVVTVGVMIAMTIQYNVGRNLDRLARLASPQTTIETEINYYQPLTQSRHMHANMSSECLNCTFPFTYLGVTYEDCTTTDKGKSWCSNLTDEHGQHVDKQWMYCPMNTCRGCKLITPLSDWVLKFYNRSNFTP